jgi:hypothetical protein
MTITITNSFIYIFAFIYLLMTVIDIILTIKKIKLNKKLYELEKGDKS